MACPPICGFLILELGIFLSDKMGKNFTLVANKSLPLEPWSCSY